MKRRTGVFAGVAVVAAAAGAGGAAWWRAHERPRLGSTDLWSMRFDRPGGGAPLVLADFQGRPLLLNFWATWCPPCVSELPLLDRFEQGQPAGGFKVAGLAIDNLEPVEKFLAQHPVRFDIGLAGSDGIALARALGNTTGALPFSVVFGRDGQLIDRRLGVVHEADLRHWHAAAV